LGFHNFYCGDPSLLLAFRPCLESHCSKFLFSAYLIPENPVQFRVAPFLLPLPSSCAILIYYINNSSRYMPPYRWLFTFFLLLRIRVLSPSISYLCQFRYVNMSSPFLPPRNLATPPSGTPHSLRIAGVGLSTGSPVHVLKREEFLLSFSNGPPFSKLACRPSGICIETDLTFSSPRVHPNFIKDPPSKPCPWHVAFSDPSFWCVSQFPPTEGFRRVPTRSFFLCFFELLSSRCFPLSEPFWTFLPSEEVFPLKSIPCRDLSTFTSLDLTR